jgi:hypothetical protein
MTESILNQEKETIINDEVEIQALNDGITDLIEVEFTGYAYDVDPFSCCTPEKHCYPYSPFFNTQAEIDEYEADILAKTRSNLQSAN